MKKKTVIPSKKSISENPCSREGKIANIKKRVEDKEKKLEIPFQVIKKIGPQ